MALPLLQVALDNFTIEEALQSTKVLAPEVDIIEVGTLLSLATGSGSISTLRTLYPDNILVADLKIVDAGGELANMACSKGANWVTVMCNAANATKEKAVEAAAKLNCEIQVELFGNWTFDEAEEWKKIGLKQVIYHQSRDALNSGGSWGEENMKVVKKLAEMGFEVSVTGGLTLDVLKLFKGIPIKSFIVGRNLRNASDPASEARLYKDEIKKYWAS
ncbi:MAG: 3-keto-L-gulonate-6-phosphate decarboxylase UlaD [Spirochaetaceae bacterium]